LAWLQGMTAKDLGISFENGKEFAATQEMTEEFRQEISYQSAFGSDRPVLRRLRPADEGSITFSVVLLKQGVASKMNDENLLRSMQDFDIQVTRGNVVQTYRGCNWNTLTIRSTLDQVTLDASISVPGNAAPSSGSTLL
jgi:hypothetical protein